MGSKGSSSSTFTPPPEVVAAYKEALGYGRAAMGQQYQPYTGEITAPLTPTQESGIYNVNRAVGTAIPYFGQATQLTYDAAGKPIMPSASPQISQAGAVTGDITGRAITPQQFSQEAIQQYQSPYTQAVADATFRNLREQQKQEQEALQSGAIRAGAFGGDRAGIAAANMARQQDLATAQAMSQIYNQGYGQAVGLFGQQQGVNLQAQQADAARQLQAAQQLYGIGAGQQAIGLSAEQANAARQMQAAQQLAGLGQGLQGSVLQGAQAQLAAGAQQQAVQQAINSGYYNQYLGAQAYPYQQAQFFANLATGVGGQMGGTTTGQQAQPSPAGSIFGALGALGSIFSASDKRVKENIKPIGKTNDGQTIYRYNFKGDPATQIGLIAQEVEKKHPEAVRTFNGVKAVDYKEATDDSVHSMGGVVPARSNSARYALKDGGTKPDENYMADDIARLSQFSQASNKAANVAPGSYTANDGTQMRGRFVQSGPYLDVGGGVSIPLRDAMLMFDASYGKAPNTPMKPNIGVRAGLQIPFEHGGLVPSMRHNFAAGGPSLSDEEDPMIPYKAGVPSKVLQIPKLARIGGTKPNFGGSPPGPVQGPSSQDFKGAAEGLGKLAKKYDLFGSKSDSSSSDDEGEARGGAIKGHRLRFEDGREIPKTDDTIAVSQSDSDPGPGLVPNSDLPPAFRKGELSGQADEEGTPVGGVVPRPDIPLPPIGRPIDLSFPLIRKEEGFQARPIKDTDLKPRIGWSSDTQTTPEGKKITTNWESKSTPEEAEHDLTRRVSEGQAWIKSQIGEEAWDQLSPEAQAAMTSIRYQYGGYPKQVLAAAATGDSNAVARAISTVGGPTPARRATEVALIGGKDIGLGNYQPGEAGYERLLKGKGAGSGGLGAARRTQLAQADTGTATDANKNWPGFGVAGEGKRSVVESLMGKDLDPIQKRALFAFFAGMAASPSPWFGQQLGAGMQAASNVYNQSMDKQAEIGVKGQQLELEKQKIGVSERLAGVQEKTKGLEYLKFLQSQYIEIPTGTPGVYMYRTPRGDTITQEQFNAEMADAMQKYGITPADVKKPSAAGLGAAAAPGAAGAPQTGVVPPPATTKEEKTAPAETTAPAGAPAPAEAPKPQPAPVKKNEAELGQERIEAAKKKYPNVDPAFLPETLEEKARDARVKAQNARLSNNEKIRSTAAGYEKDAELYQTQANEIRKGDRPVQFTDDTPTGPFPGAVETKITREAQEKGAAKNLESNLKLRDQLAIEEKKALTGKVTAMRIKDILESFRGGALADERNKAGALLKEVGALVGKPVTDDMIDTWVANPREYDKYVKETTKLAFNFVNDADVGKRMTNLEMTTAGRAQAGPTTDPQASGDMIAEALAFSKYQEDMRRGILSEMARVGPEKFNEAQFIADYNDKYGQKHFEKLYKEIRQNMGIRGATPANRNALVPGQVYIIEPGTYNNRTGKPIKMRFMGNEKLPGNQIKTTFDPVE